MVDARTLPVKVVGKESRRGLFGRKHFVDFQVVDPSARNPLVVRDEVPRSRYNSLNVGNVTQRDFYTLDGRTYFPSRRGAEDAEYLLGLPTAA